MLTSYFIGILTVVTITLITILWPTLLSNPSYSNLATIPTHAFPLAILCGAGAGIIAFGASAAVVYSGTRFSGRTWFYVAVPEAISALVTATVTSILCGIWGVLDVASALYFAPLFYPSICFSLIFSVQWVSVSIGSCTSAPLHFIFYGIVIVIFVKIPVNLMGSLVFLALFRPGKPAAAKLKVIGRRLVGSRRHFLISANSCLFLVGFPYVQLLMESFDVIQMTVLWGPGIMCLCGWILTSIGIGVNVLMIRFRSDADWAIFSFTAGAGGPVVLWAVQNIWSVVAEGRTSTMQQTLHPALTGIVCSGLALAGGTISVLSSVIWMRLRGEAPRRLTD
jgi:hypothetical protein